MWGFAPTRRVTFVSAKVTKTISARMRPQGGPSAYAPNNMARELAPLKQPSPKSRFGAPAPPHPKTSYGVVKPTILCIGAKVLPRHVC